MTQLQEYDTVSDAATTSPADARWYGAASVHVALFLHHLRRLPASMWLAATEHIDLDAGATGGAFDEPATRLSPLLEAQADYAARCRLHRVLESMPAVVRRIRQRVNNDLTIFDGIVSEAALQRMRRAANLAAFALAAHAHLSHDDLERLYRPFADLIPPPRELFAAN
jgi:hypothetical protein